MNLLNLPETEFATVKKQLLDQGLVFESKKITDYQAKYFETVTISNTLIKFFMFFSLAVYVLVNLAGLVITFIYNPSNGGTQLGTLVGVGAICLIVAAIFLNINTNVKKEEYPIYLKNRHFIFNFSNGVVETPTLFYNLPIDHLTQIEFVVHKLSKKQILGSVKFTFKLLDYEVVHALRYTNLTAIEDYLARNLPNLLHLIICDGKRRTDQKPMQKPARGKNYLIGAAVLLSGVLLLVLPGCLHYYRLALIIAGAILTLTALLILLSGWLYVGDCVPGLIISSIFIIIGVCVPWFIWETSGLSLLDYVIQDPQILLPTIFGIIGLCLYTHLVVIIVGKLCYCVQRRLTPQ